MGKVTPVNAGLEEAILAAGGQTPLARICGVGVNVVNVARSTGRCTPRMAARIHTYLDIPMAKTAPYLFEDEKEGEGGGEE